MSGRAPSRPPAGLVAGVGGPVAARARPSVDATIRDARFPNDAATVRALFAEYAAGLGVDLGFQDFDAELAGLPGRYVAPAGGLWLATAGDGALGCIALRSLDADTCELKRLFVRPSARGLALGQRLAHAALARGAAAGHARAVLDTLPSMGPAVALYRSLGFVATAPYCHNPIPGALFFERRF